MVKRDISDYQGTVAKTIYFAGVGLHSGKLIQLEVHPDQAGSGISFLRSDIKGAEKIQASPHNISDTKLCTTVGFGTGKVSTIEHLMAAFAGLGVDNALVKVSADEIPILDGSSAPFVDKLLEVGIQLQNAKRALLILPGSLEIRVEDQFIRYEPPSAGQKKPGLEISCAIDFTNSKAIGFQSLELPFSKKSFMEICEARTFCHARDVDIMRSLGLALGGSLDNAVVVNEEKVLNNDGLRYKDEFVRHKFLDLLGDLALLNGRLVGKITTYKSGHSLHAAFTKKVYQYMAGAEWVFEKKEAPLKVKLLGKQQSFS